MDVGRVLIAEAELQRRVKELGEIITADYRGRDLFLVCVLKGAALFWADLSRTIALPQESDFIAVESYQGDRPAGPVRLLKDLDTPIAGREVLIVEDIVDTGRTLAFLRAHLFTKAPKSLKTCALLNKAGRREVEVPIEYVGFVIPNEFVIGYGLDFDGRFRNLPHIAVLDGI